MKNPTPAAEALQLLKIFEDTLDFIARRGGCEATMARSLIEKSRGVRARLSPPPSRTVHSEPPGPPLVAKPKGKAK